MAKDKRDSRENHRRGLLEILNDWCKRHWFLYTIIISLPSALFGIILPYFGNYLKFIEESNGATSFTVLGLILTVSIVVIVGIFVFLNNLYLSKTEKSNLEKLKGEIQYQSEILQNVNRICQEKFSSLKNIIESEKYSNIERASIVTNPRNQLSRIIDGITECLVKLLDKNGSNFKFGDLLVTITYRFPQEGDNEWKWVDGGGERDMELDELLSQECKSTFNYLLNNTKGIRIYFNNSKEDAKRSGKYVYTSQDEANEELGEIVGSILCIRHQVKNNGRLYVDAMISITTQKKRFARQDRIKIVRENMISLINVHFAKRIGIELSLLYLDYLKTQEMPTINN